MTTDAEQDHLLGQTLAGQFQILERLGAGGMGAVYLAEQSDMGRRVVIKVMHPELTVGNPQAVERFKREARAVAALNHPHIVQVYVFGQADDGRMYLAMEFIEGRDLAGEIQRGPLPQGRALKILDQVAAALIEAHTHGVVHRDLKPENIMLANRHGNPDWVKVLDFGIAKVGAASDAKDAPALTQQGAIFGTPRYMAPEQIIGGTVDARTDLYALGIILYEMLTGDHPFKATSALDYLMKHVQDAVVMPSLTRPELGIHAKVDEIIERLLAKKQDERFQSAAELQREVRVALGLTGDTLSHTLSLSAAAIREAVRESERADTVTHAPGMLRRKSSHAWLWALLGLLLVGGGVAAAVLALGKPAAGEPLAMLTPPTATTPPSESDVAADPADTDTPDTTVDTADTAPDSAPIDVQIVRAGSPVDGFPVPEGTTLLANEPMQLRFESTLSATALVDFYQSELAGRVKQVGSGFEVTDPTSPWAYIYISNSGDRLGITASRRAAAVVAKPAPVRKPPVVKPKPVVAPAPVTNKPPRTWRDQGTSTTTPAPAPGDKPTRTHRPR